MINVRSVCYLCVLSLLLNSHAIAAPFGKQVFAKKGHAIKKAKRFHVHPVKKNKRYDKAIQANQKRNQRTPAWGTRDGWRDMTPTQRAEMKEKIWNEIIASDRLP